MAKGIDHKKLFNPEKIFIQAEAFLRLANAGHLSSLNPSLIGNPVFGDYISFAAFVNQSFACELYFKCIAVIEKNEFIPTHNLLTLFNDLSQSCRDYLTQRNDVDTIYNFTMYQFTRQKRPKTLIELLTEAQEYFTDMRYFFEGNKYTDFDLSFSMGFMKEYIFKMRPDFEEITKMQ
ncbi:MAG: hypothetical protein ACXVBR_16975 [Flavisolibacter sp.]